MSLNLSTSSLDLIIRPVVFLKVLFLELVLQRSVQEHELSFRIFRFKVEASLGLLKKINNIGQI